MGINAVKITAQSHEIFSADFNHMGSMPHNIGNGSRIFHTGSAGRKKVCAEIQARHTAFYRQRPYHIVRQISGAGTECSRIAVACHKGLLGHLQYIEKTRIRHMGNIHNHSHFLHALHKFPALFRQTMLRVGRI